MKRNLLTRVLFTLSFLFSASGFIFADNNTSTTVVSEDTKFYVGVTGYNGTETATVSATVYDGFGFTVELPAVGSDEVGADKATINVIMQNVASLNVEGIREHSTTINTGVTGITAKLSEYLSSTYNFEGATSPVTVIDIDHTEKTFIYNIAGITSDNKIVGTPETSADASAAWNIITSHVTSTTKADGDSYYVVKKGTYIQLGNERLTFDSDAELLDGSWTISELVDEVEGAASLATVDGLTGADTYKPIIFLPAGTSLAIGGSVATLENDATITIDLSNLYDDENELTGYLTEIKENVDKGAKAAIFYFMNLFDDIVSFMDVANNVPIEVRFAEKEVETSPVRYKTSVDDTEWTYMFPNDEGYYEIEDGAYTAFEVLEDVPNVNVKYTRTFAYDVWAAWLVPFELKVNGSEDYNLYQIQSVEYDTDTDIDAWEIGIYKQTSGTIKANLPYVVKPSAVGTYTITAEGVTLKRTTEDGDVKNVVPISSAYIFTFIGTYNRLYVTDDFKDWFALGAKSGNLSRQTDPSTGNYINPFRWYLEVTNNPDNPYAEEDASGIKRIFFADKSEATDIKQLSGEETTGVIYDLSGRRVNNPTKGIYIMDGKKMYIK